MPINLGEWNFLHCAIDTENNYFYMNTYRSKYSIDYSPNYNPDPNIQIIIKDLSTSDWCVLFYRNILLRKDCFPNVDFLSMININNQWYTPKFKKDKWEEDLDESYKDGTNKINFTVIMMVIIK